MPRLFAAVAAVVALAVAAPADDKKKDDFPLKGTWVREAEGMEITFKFKSKTELEVIAEAGGAGVTLVCKCEFDGDKVKAKATEVKEKGDFPAKPPVGFEFKCVFKLDKDDKGAAKLTEFEADNADQAKAVVEGEYKKKKSD